MSNQYPYEYEEHEPVEQIGFFQEETESEDIAIGKQGRMRVVAGVMDFVLLIVGLVIILLAIALLATLINWVVKDLYRSFFIIQTTIQ